MFLAAINRKLFPAVASLRQYGCKQQTNASCCGLFLRAEEVRESAYYELEA